MSDSDLDLLLYGGGNASEALTDVICELQHPLMSSHHDLIISSCSLPLQTQQRTDQSN